MKDSRYAPVPRPDQAVSGPMARSPRHYFGRLLALAAPLQWGHWEIYLVAGITILLLSPAMLVPVFYGFKTARENQMRLRMREELDLHRVQMDTPLHDLDHGWGYEVIFALEGIQGKQAKLKPSNIQGNVVESFPLEVQRLLGFNFLIGFASPGHKEVLARLREHGLPGNIKLFMHPCPGAREIVRVRSDWIHEGLAVGLGTHKDPWALCLTLRVVV
jgi:hypothetical protein